MIVFHLSMAWLSVIIFSLILGLFGFYVVAFILGCCRPFIQKDLPKVSLKNPWMKRLFLFLVGFNSFFYIQQCYEWISPKESAYPSAKCYYAAGNVVALYRAFLSPSNPITYWLVYPQYLLYAMATPLIPHEDGELALWRYHWFVYPHARDFSMPHYLYESNTNPFLRKEGAVATFTWEFIKAVHNDNFSDKNIREQHALRDLPLAALYLDEMYNHEKVPSSIFVTPEAEEVIAHKPIVYSKDQLVVLNAKTHDPARAEKEKKMFRAMYDNLWLVNQKSYYIATTAYEALNALASKWENSPLMQKELKQHPSLEATRIAAMIAMLQGGALASKFSSKELSCTHPYVLHYIALRQELKAMAQNTTSLLIDNLDKRYLERHISAETMKYTFEKYCGYTLIGGYDTRFGSGPSRYENMTLDYGKVLLDNQQTK